MIVNYGDGTIGDQYPNISWEEEIELCRKSVDILNNMRPLPSFFIVCGDLVDAMPDQWPDIRKEQEKDFLKIYSDLDPEIPLVCVCGNHDVGNRPTKDLALAQDNWLGNITVILQFRKKMFKVVNISN